MARAAVVAKRMQGEDARSAQPWRAELEELGALLAESRGEHRPGDALRDRIAAIVAEEAGDRLSASLVRRIADRAARALG